MKIYDTPGKKRWVNIVGIIASLGGVLTAANLVFGTEIRPAWAWELNSIISVSEAQYTELKTNQLRIHFDVLDTRREGLRRDLTSFKVEAERFRREEKPIPDWLQHSIAETEDQIRRVEVEQERLQHQLRGILVDNK